MRDPERAWRRLLTVVVMCVAASAGAAGGAAADVVTERNESAQRTVASVNPQLQSRSMAIVQASVADAVGAVLGEYEPIVSRPAAAAGASAPAAVVAAAHGALVALHAGAAPSLGSALTASLAAIHDSPGKAEGIRAGKATTARPLGGRPGEWAP